MDHDYAVHVLNLPQSFSIDQLRCNYKKMALLLHPDRRTLDTDSANRLFSILTDSYKFLRSETEHSPSPANDADWLTMRSDSDQRHSRKPDSHDAQPEANFNIDGFNHRFSDTRLGDENDRGYSSWMQRLSPDDAAAKQKIRVTQDRSRSLVCSEPEALPSASSVPHSELGLGRVRDFGRHVEVAGHRNLGYTDYKIAHMTASCLIDPEIVSSRQQFDSVEDYESARSLSAAASMTPLEKASIARHEAAIAGREGRRLTALKNRDELISTHHVKINRSLL